MLKRINPKIVFLFLSINGIAAFFFLAYFNGEASWVWLIQESDPHIRALDYIVHIATSFKEIAIYDFNGDTPLPVFPPLAYLMYQFFYKLGFANVNEIVYNAENIIAHNINAFIYGLYSVFSILLLLYSFITFIWSLTLKLSVSPG